MTRPHIFLKSLSVKPFFATLKRNRKWFIMLGASPALLLSAAVWAQSMGPDHERCRILSSSTSTATCRISSSTVDIRCEWRTDPTSSSCSSEDGSSVSCEVRAYPFRDVIDIFCHKPIFYPADSPAQLRADKRVVLTDDDFGGPRDVTYIIRRIGRGASSGTGGSASPTSTGPKEEDCDSYIANTREGSFDRAFQEKHRQRCLDRKAAMSRRGASAIATNPAGEDCDSYIANTREGSFDRSIQEKLRQKCLDRRAGVSTQSLSTTCVSFGNVMRCN